MTLCTRTVRLVSFLAWFALLAAPAVAQGRGGGGGGAAGGAGRMRRAPEIDERVGAFFATVPPVAGAPTDGAEADPKTADLLTQLPFVVAAAGSRQRSVVYLYDATASPEAQGQFERALFTDEVGVALRFFVAGRIDVSAASAGPLRQRYGKQLPLFVAFDAGGKRSGEVSMGTRPDPKALVALLDRTVGKANQLALPAFVKQYLDVVRDLEQLAVELQQIDDRQQRADSADKQKRAELDKERKQNAAAQKKALAAERALLEKVDLPPRAEGSERVGRGGGRGGAGGGGRRGG